MELRHLRYFLTVAEEGHFGRAAERLHIVQPALSMQIRALEEELGTPLFIRTTRKVELSAAGRLLIIEAQRTIEQAERAKSLIQKSARGEIGSVRIGFAGNAVLTGKLSEDLQYFHADYPEVTLELREMAPALQEEAILEGRLDVGYCPALGSGFSPGLVVDHLGSWPWEVAMASHHRLAKRRTLSAKLLAEEPFIIYAADGADEGQLAMLHHVLGREPRIAHKVSNTLSVLALAAAGLGLALVPASLSKVTVPNIVYKRLTGRTVASQLVAISRNADEPGAVQRFLEQLRSGIPQR
jgi:DNA-binding transcriptional LysR family regulator